ASKLESATAALVVATDDQVVDVVAGTEMALADISLSEVAVPEVASALDRLHRTLDGLKSAVPPALVERFDRLIATVQEAEVVAQLSASPGPMPSAVLN